jgi:hypothetical protein
MVSVTPRQRFAPGTHWIGGWVRLRAGLDTEARGNFFTSAGDRALAVQSVVRHYIDSANPAKNNVYFVTSFKIRNLILKHVAYIVTTKWLIQTIGAKKVGLSKKTWR